VPKSLVPDVGAGGDGGVEAAGWRGHADGVQIATGVTSEDHRLGLPILDRETKVIKLNINRIISTECFN
jgi:hypothetical protein